MGRTAATLLLGFLLCAASSPRAAGKGGGAEAPSPYGINAHVPTEEDYRTIQKAGFGWVRVDLTWNWVEPTPGLFRWDLTDRVVEGARERDIKVLGILGYCPPWASSGPDPFYPPKETAAWKNYVRATVARYRGQVRHWILWNEPNCRTFFRGDLDEYVARVLIPGARAVKEADPGALVCGPDLAHLGGCEWDAWLTRLMGEQGALYDVITHHCYKDDAGDVFRQLEGPKWFWEPPAVRDILKKAGQAEKPFFLTEAGWRSNKVGEKEQAANLVALLRGVGERPWIHKVFLYELRDSAFEPGFGLQRRDGSLKPAFRAVKRFIREHPAKTP